MIKLTNKTKYTIDDNGDVTIYAKLKAGGWGKVASCHVSCIDHIKAAGSLSQAQNTGVPIIFC